MPSNEDAMRNAMKQALKEWLDEKYAEFGRWSLHAILAMALTALTYFILTHNGWTPPAVPAVHPH